MANWAMLSHLPCRQRRHAASRSAFESGRTLLIDLNIRAAADDPDDDTPDVASRAPRPPPAATHQGQALRRRLADQPSRQGPLYRACKSTFTSAPRRLVHDPPTRSLFERSGRRPWSSAAPLERYTLCDDAKAFNTEARRRVRRFREVGDSVADGDPNPHPR